jgi:hypothetical protein
MFGILKISLGSYLRGLGDLAPPAQAQKKIRLCLENLESRTLLSGFTPIQIRHAYGFDQVRFLGGMVPGDGSGQTIAIIDAYHDPNIFSDLDVFDTKFSFDGNQSLFDQYGPSSKFLTQAFPDGKPQTDPGWSLEISLDVEWAHAIAPGAKILLVEAATTSYNSIIDAVDYARHQIGVVAVSMSWGSEEFQPEAIFDNYFTTPFGHLGGSDGFGGFNLPGGITFVAASGDYGSPPEWPAVSPNVLAVGGTTLNLDSAGNYQFETPWLFSGGGISFYEPRPAYQTGTPSYNLRSNPDVSFAADPTTGFAIYDSVGISNLGGWLRVGGTSAGAPQWAALIAITDQGRALQGLGSLDGPTQLLPAIYNLPDSVFHQPQGTGTLIPGSTYSLETGRGSPIANLLIPVLPGVSPPPTPPPVVITPPVENTPGSPSSGSEPIRSNPPSKTDPGHELTDVKIIVNVQTQTLLITTVATETTTLPRTNTNSEISAVPARLPDGPVITGIGSSRESDFTLDGKPPGINKDPFAENKEEQEFINEEGVFPLEPFPAGRTSGRSNESKILTNQATPDPAQPTLPSNPRGSGTEAPPMKTKLPLDRYWERIGFLIVLATGTLLGPYFINSNQRKSPPNH